MNLALILCPASACRRLRPRRRPAGELLTFVLGRRPTSPAAATPTGCTCRPSISPIGRPACSWAWRTSPEEAAAVLDELIARKQMPVTIGVFVGAGAGRPQPGARQPRRRLRPLPAGGAAARRGEAPDQRRPAAPAVARRQRPGHRRHRQRGGGRLHRRLGAAGGLQPGLQRRRRLRRHARRRPLPGPGPQVRAAGRCACSCTPRPGRRQRLRFGDWWLANQALHRALRWAGYEVGDAWARRGPTGGARPRSPRRMRWLWRGWPAAGEGAARPEPGAGARS